MTGPLQSLVEVQRRWGLAGLEPLAETRTSRLWRAQSPAHGAVVLKSLKPYGAAEITGVALMRWQHGQGAARIFAVEGAEILMEFLPGPLLGDLARQGRDGEAASALAETAAAIQQRSAPPPAGLMPLETYIGALFSADLAALPVPSRPAFAQARDLARHLLATSPEPRPLHGDLHHDNILMGPRGWAAIDAKGVMGDPAYEVANAFRNPVGCEQIAADPARIALLAQVFSARLGLPETRILDWAAAQVAISLAWSLGHGDAPAEDLRLLPAFLAARPG